MDDETRRSHGGAFDRAADTYAKFRPGYPREAAAWVATTMPKQVLDLGAGTGALTAELVTLGHWVVAADPSLAMLHRLGGIVAPARRVLTLGEQLPFDDESFDVVTVAGAFHWMDQELAIPELARVLRPRGALGFLYNTRAETTSWTRELGALILSAQPPGLEAHWGAGSVAAVDGTGLFTPRSYREFRWSQPLTRNGVVGLVASRSYVINLDNVRRTQILRATADIFDRYAADAGDAATTLDLPYITQVWRTHRR